MTLLWIALGAFLGWNFPQPFWAKMIQAAIATKWAAFKARK